MPWTETCVMEERVKFIMEVLDGTYCMAELCNYYGISRKTGYKWLTRYRQGDIEALRNRSRKPHSHPNEISCQVKESILSIKKRFPKWGAAKIRARLERIHPAWDSYPAISTIGLFLHKQGLTNPRKRRRKATPTELPLTGGLYSNQVWCADFKGHLKTGDGSRCNPLTISDHSSRYLLCCRHLDRMSYGQFNGFCAEYNEHRPHEVLEMRTPSECYCGSIRKFPSRLPQVSYPDHMQIKKVYQHGDIMYKGKRFFVTESLCSEYVGIDQIDDDVSLLWYCGYLLGRIDLRKWRISSIESQPLSSAGICGAKRP